jgi:hypothetical protein
MTNYLPPYRPFRGAEPPHFVDRADDNDVLGAGIVAASVDAYAAGPCDPRFFGLVTGSPAAGKTATLRAIAKEVSSRLGWAVVFHRCQAKERVISRIADEVGASARASWPDHLGRFAHDVLLLGYPAGRTRFGPVPCWLSPGEEASWTSVRHFVKLAGMFARSIARGFVLIFDDADRLPTGELETLGYLARNLLRAELPVAFVFSGCPELQATFSRSGNLSARPWHTPLPMFGDDESREALVVPAAERGVEFEHEALDLLCAASGGSPLEVQRLGFAAWSAARGARVITLAAAEEAAGPDVLHVAQAS